MALSRNFKASATTSGCTAHAHCASVLVVQWQHTQPPATDALDILWSPAAGAIAAMDHARVLVRSVARAFYDTECIVVIDALVNHSAYVEQPVV